MAKKKCCGKFIKKGKHCGSCPIKDDCKKQQKLKDAKGFKKGKKKKKKSAKK